MSIIAVFKKPAIFRLWLIRAIPVYVFLFLSFAAVKYGPAFYLKHRYPSIIILQGKKILGLKGSSIDVKEARQEKWVITYNKWLPYFYFVAMGVAFIGMFALLKSTPKKANDLFMAALEKAEKAEVDGNFSQAIYYLKMTSSFGVDQAVLDDIERKIENLQSPPSRLSVVAAKTSADQGRTAIGKIVVNKNTDSPQMIGGRYKKIGKLGQGGMGIVWLADDKVLERKIAIKELPVQFTYDKDFKDRFLREAKLLAKLTHPNIVQIYDIIDDNEVLCYAMELIDGASLDAILKSSKLATNKIFNYAIQMLKGMEYAHSMKIVHRDLKPMNIMVRKDGIIKIADFGLAKLVGSLSLTMAGTVMGSPVYMSPEQALGEEVDERSDIYSFSMILYEMITGSPAFKGSPAEVIAQQVHNNPPLPSSVVEIPQWLDEYIIKGLAKDKLQRHQSASAMLAFLAENTNFSD